MLLNYNLKLFSIPLNRIVCFKLETFNYELKQFEIKFGVFLFGLGLQISLLNYIMRFIIELPV